MWIRTAAKEDISAIEVLLSETLHATYDDLIGSDQVNVMIGDYEAGLLKKCLNRPLSEYVVADDGEMIHGVAYAVQGAMKGNSEIAVLYQLCIKPESQGQGIGQRLLIEIEEAFPSARKILLSMNQTNKKAVQFFEHQGYKRSLLKHDNMPTDDVFMEKSLF